jgi:hypothetical protein
MQTGVNAYSDYARLERFTMTDTRQQGTPIACNLNSEAQAERQRVVTEKLFSDVLETEELTDGYAYRFSGEQEILEQVTAFVLFERQCCPFFTFELIFEPEQGPVTLKLRGPEGTKEFLGSFP